MSCPTRVWSTIALAATLLVASSGSDSWATLITFTGATSAANTNAAGTAVYTYPTSGAITTFLLDNTATNFNVAYTAGDDLVFNGTAAGAAGTTYNLAVSSTLQTPTSITFSDTPGTGVGKNYNFLRASTSAGSGLSLGFTGGTAGATVDSYSSISPFGSAGPPLVTLTLASNYTGKVTLRARAANAQAAGSVTNINGGTLEIQDALALPASAQNTPNVNLGGGTLAININTGNYETGEGNVNPASGNLAGTLTISGNSTLANTQTNFVGDNQPHRQNNIWNGPITLNNTGGDATLNVLTGGGTLIAGTGAFTTSGGANNATVNLAGSNSYLRLGSNTMAAGSTAVAFNLGSASGILDSSAGTGNFVANLGSLTGGANTALRGTTSTGTTTYTYSIGTLNLNDTFNGQIINSANAQTGGTGPTTALLKQVGIAKVGTGTLTLTSANRYSGATSVSGGTLQAGNARALGDSASAINVNAGGTVDLNGFTQFTGKSFVLGGGSLVNNGGTAVSIHSGASGNIADSATANSNGAIWGAGTSTTNGQITTLPGGTVPTVSITGGGGSGAVAALKMQVGWLRINPGVIGSAGSGYNKAPTLTIDAPSDPNGRAAKAFVTINTSGQVAAVQVVDPGWGYTSVPNITIDNTGTGGTGFIPVLAMAGSELAFSNTGSGYTSAPTITVGNLGVLPANAGSTSALVAPIAVGGFGQMNLTANSNIGGSGALNVGVPISSSGVFGLTKIGAGTTTLSAANTFTGTTTVNAGTLLVNGSTVSDTSVGTGAILGGTGSINNNVFVGAGGTIAPGTSIGTLGTGIPQIGVTLINGTMKADYDGTGTGSIDLLNVAGTLVLGTTSTIEFDQITAANDPAYVFAKYNTLAGTFANVVGLPAGYTINYAFNTGSGLGIALVQVPEPSTFALLAVGGLVLLARRRV
jgi:fibronectin-binding autotransporter adhesin